MQNDRPIENPSLQKALGEFRETLRKYGFAGACMIVAPDEAAFTYKMDAAWSALRADDTTPLGFRFTANSKADGHQETMKRVGGAMHTICQVADFGTQTVEWMGQLKAMLRAAGIDFEHTPFAGRPLPELALRGRPPE